MAELLPKIAVQVVTYWTEGGAEDIRKCFAALEGLSYPRDRWCLVIVDNPSSEGDAVEFIQREVLLKSGEEFPEVFFVRSDENVGFAGGHDVAYGASVDWGAEFVYLLNQDAVVKKDALRRVAECAVEASDCGVVQSRIMLAGSDRLNSCGNCLNFLGFGFSDGKGDTVGVAYERERLHFYASGAAVLVRVAAVEAAGGLFYRDYFMYHEDVDLSWRIRLAGWGIAYCHDSSVAHRYEFSRSILKFYWMERNRFFTHFVNFRVGTLVLILPMMVFLEAGSLFFSMRSGWFFKKVQAYGYFLKVSTWRLIRERRRVVRRIRIVSDREILKSMVGYVAAQEVDSFAMRVANVFMIVWFWMVKKIIFW